MTRVPLTFLLACSLVLAVFSACGDTNGPGDDDTGTDAVGPGPDGGGKKDGGHVGDGGKLDTLKTDGVLADQSTVDGTAVADNGVATDHGATGSDGQVTDTVGPSPDWMFVDATAPHDGPLAADASTPGDMGYPDFINPPADGTVVFDMPVSDGPVVVGDGTVVVDAPQDQGIIVGDYSVWPDLIHTDTFIGQNDAGQYMCRNAFTGMVVPCACNDGVDNDGDGATDYPNDTGCTSTSDNSELNGATQCSDGVDNDGDGRIDNRDYECTGPLDNDESSFATGIPGDNKDCKQDCFFDGNSGAGDDGCEWDIRCDPLPDRDHLDKNCPYYGTPLPAAKCPAHQTPACLSYCKPLSPNGCDCFGCCAIPLGDGSFKAVMLTATCHMGADGLPIPSEINDPAHCQPCTQVQDCVNPCGECEYCIGKPTLPAHCLVKPDAYVWTRDASPPDGWVAPDQSVGPTCENGYPCDPNNDTCDQVLPSSVCWWDGCCRNMDV